jgi:hypothetical protein
MGVSPVTQNSPKSFLQITYNKGNISCDMPLFCLNITVSYLVPSIVRNAVLTEKEGADFFGGSDFNAGNLNRSTRYVACRVLRIFVATLGNIHSVDFCVMIPCNLVSSYHSLYHIPGYLPYFSMTELLCKIKFKYLLQL